MLHQTSAAMLEPKPPVTLPSTAPVAEIRPAPENVSQIKEDLQGALSEVADLNGDGVFDQADIDLARETAVDWINPRVDIPWIGERIERIILNMAAKVILSVSRRWGVKAIQAAIDRIG